MTEPVVSVCIVTYQHARFIAQAVEGALMQRTNFPFEVLIGEDESTDGTREICQDFEKRYPGLVRVFLRSRRDVVFIDGRPRGSYNFRMTLREAQGEFVALCEGDDYWTDPEKLQRQVDYLRANPDCVGCFHDTKLVDGDGRVLAESYFQSEQEKFNQQDVLATLMSREPTCSLVFRRAACTEPLPEWYLRRPSDLYLDILLTSHGSLGFVRRNMGAYRKHAGGVWGGQRESNQIIELIIRFKLLLSEEYFFTAYQETLFKKIDEFQSALFTRQDAAAEIKRLAGIVHLQTATIESLQAECARLTEVVTEARKESARAVCEAQQHIDALKAEMDRLAATAKQQTSHITVLEKEKARLTDLAADREMSSSAYLQVLEEQKVYIASLIKERDRLADLVNVRDMSCADYLKVIDEQTAYISLLVNQPKSAQ